MITRVEGNYHTSTGTVTSTKPDPFRELSGVFTLSLTFRSSKKFDASPTTITLTDTWYYGTSFFGTRSLLCRGASLCTTGPRRYL